MYAILNDELYHHGIKGQKWGVRRFQNADGSRTYAGKQRFSKDSKGRIQDNNSPMNKIKSNKKRDVLNHPIKNTKEKFSNLDPDVKKALAAVAITTTLAVALTKNAHKNDTKQRMKRAKNIAKLSSSRISRFNNY